ncbi:transposase [Streptomyces mirabilis]|uniref:transposase n=1 Tax=Streptomyces mirabilis TaxID=68239 RepID=UPI00371EE317
MDEFAFRKGCTYGTILVDVDVDVEAGQVVDVLPDRTSETFAAWLKEHPGAENICRDRATAYTKAVKEAAPNALEVADRWHLLQNLSAAVEKTSTSTATACANTPSRSRSRPCRNRSQWNCPCRNCPALRSSNGPVTAMRTSAAWCRRVGPSVPSRGA